MKSAYFQQKAPVVNVIGLIAAVVGIVSTFLAKVTATVNILGYKDSASEGIFKHYGWLMAALFLATAIIYFLRMDHAALIVAVVNTVFVLFKVIQELTTDLGDYGDYAKISVNFFFWLALIAAIVDVAAVFVGPMLLAKKNNSQPTL